MRFLLSSLKLFTIILDFDGSKQLFFVSILDLLVYLFALDFGFYILEDKVSFTLEISDGGNKNVFFDGIDMYSVDFFFYIGIILGVSALS